MPRCFGASGSVRARRMPHWEWLAQVDQIFWPLTMYSSPSRTACVRREARSLPASGSEKSWVHSAEPSRMLGSHRCCCSGVPPATMVGPAHPIAIALSGGVTPAAASSSATATWSAASAASPHGSGQCGATSPASASWRPVGSGCSLEPGADLEAARIDVPVSDVVLLSVRHRVGCLTRIRSL